MQADIRPGLPTTPCFQEHVSTPVTPGWWLDHGTPRAKHDWSVDSHQCRRSTPPTCAIANPDASFSVRTWTKIPAVATLSSPCLFLRTSRLGWFYLFLCLAPF
ncbi:hypothetical protein LIA77_08636 [Sarocladium implicatum]|nr:hypothetical protein LIA77_08636 [Sarocladium implicatum]